MSSPLDSLTPEQRKQLIARVAERVRTQMQRELVPPLSSVHGTWQDKGDLRALANVGAGKGRKRSRRPGAHPSLCNVCLPQLYGA